jgi:nucleoside-diphosphate-sugar epimerase
MNILITGGLGYLGCELVKYLLEDSTINEIIIYDKGIYGVSHAAPLMSSKLKIVIGDIRDENNLKIHIKNSDCVIHLASLVGAPLVDRKPIESYDTNIKGTEILSSILSKSQKFIFASTGSCYGKVQGICTENTPISPLSSYGHQKALGEKIILDVGGISLRFATVYGCSFKTRNDLYINSMVQKAIIDKSAVLYEGNARRTFIHVSDAARAVHKLIKSNNINYSVYNIGDEKMSYSKIEICDEIKNLIKFNVIENQFAKDPDQRDYEVDYSRLKEIGFESKINLKTILPSIINYYKASFESSYVNG